MTLQRRLALLDWARQQDAFILEDDYDSDYRYRGRPLPSLQGLDTAGRVIYMSSFSKTILPSLRLGFLVLPSNLVEPFRRARISARTCAGGSARRKHSGPCASAGSTVQIQWP